MFRWSFSVIPKGNRMAGTVCKEPQTKKHPNSVPQLLVVVPRVFNSLGILTVVWFQATS